MTNCDIADNKQKHFDEIFNKMTSWKEHPQPAEMMERMIQMLENGDDSERQRFQSSRGCKYSQLHRSVMYEHERKAHTTSRRQQHT